MYAKLDAFDPPVRVEMPFYPEHLVSTSAWGELSGHRRSFAFGYVKSSSAGKVDARPYFVGDRVDSTGGASFPRNYHEIYVDHIDSFQKVRDQPPPGLGDLEVLRSISEEKVKTAFARIVGEPLVPKDWGGEYSDLFTTHVLVGGERVATAFAFKGPAKFSEMTFAHLGKNGDQVERLFAEPADLVIVQHCHLIHRSVRAVMRAFATSVQQPRRFCLIDGKDTLRVLRAYGECGVQ